VHVFHAIPHVGLSVSDPYTILMLISRGMMGYHLITIIIKLRRFTGPHKSDMRLIHNQMLVQRFVMNGFQSTQAGLPPLSLEYPHTTPHSSYPMILHFSLVVPPSLKFKHQSIHSILYQILTILISLRYKGGPTFEWNQPLAFYR
jgi:hypothetical protein